MRWVFFRRLGLIALLLSLSVVCNPAAETGALRVVVQMNDGSRLFGFPELKSVPFSYEFGTTEMPLVRLTSVEFTDGKGLLNLRNGDRLPGTIELKAIELQTLIGKLSLPFGQVRRIDILAELLVRDSLVLRYTFDEEDGSIVDSSGKGNHGVLIGALTRSAGQFGKALSFDGSTTAVRIPASPNLNVGAGPGLTLEAWIKPDEVNLERPIFEWSVGTGPAVWEAYGLHFWISQPDFHGPGSLYANLVDSTHAAHIFGSPRGIMTTHEFQHVALTYDKATGVAKLFRNGVVVAKENFGSFTPQTDTPLFLGSRPLGPAMATRWRGSMDELAIYNRALTEAEVQANYTQSNFVLLRETDR